MIEVPLTRGMVALVDDADAERVAGRSWCAVRRHQRWYAVANFGRERRYMHRHLMGETDPVVKIDHVNGEGLDNRRANLRRASNAANGHNRGPLGGASAFKGVFPERGRWRAQITAHGKRQSLGTFSTELEAALAYDRAAYVLHGDFARFNLKCVALAQLS